MRMYHFVTDWSFRAPCSKVWDAIMDVEAYPTWWPSFKKARIRGADKSSAVGVFIDATVGGALGDLNFTLEVSEVDLHKKLLLKSSGDLRGAGMWVFEHSEDETRVKFYWDVATTSWIMNFIGLFAKPLLTRSHDSVMASGYKVLKSRIEG